MDTEWIKQKAITDEANNIKSLDVGAGKLTWPAYLIHHYRCYRNYTVIMELEIPPTALLNDALDRMIRNETMLLKTGFAVCHPDDHFNKKTGVALAKSKMEYCHFTICRISNEKSYREEPHDCVELLLELDGELNPLLQKVLTRFYRLKFYSSGKVMLLC
jgi:hypothetical protein